MKKVEIEVGVLELRRSFSFLGGGVDHMVFKGKGGGQSSSKEYKRGTIENERGGIRILQTCGGRVNFLVNFIPTQSKSFKTPPLPPSVNDDQFPKHVFFFNFMSQP